jgi:diamine N-acetyltransferase
MLRKISPGRLAACLALSLPEQQRPWVASNVYSLAQACTDPCLHPRGIYDLDEWMHAPHKEPNMKGFVMYEVRDGAGFIMRLMIDQASQRKGYGRAAMVEVVRVLRLTPEVRSIATSHHKDNTPAANLYASLGFRPWESSASGPASERFLVLDI